MIKLDLKAEAPELEALKTYLEENVSELLADKINNGVRIEKDGKTLINKKTLETFMDYAHDEAKKLAAKGTRYACIKSDIVFGWAVHYFEEDSIEGALYNEDGTPYKPTPKTTPKANKPVSATVVSKSSKPEAKQFTLFDLVNNSPSEPVKEEPIEDVDDEETADDYSIDEETGEIIPKEKEPVQKPSSGIYQRYLQYKTIKPHAILAMRLGDFYEIFGEDAVKAANYTDLMLTSKDVGLEERVALVGFPVHAEKRYFELITDYQDLMVVIPENNDYTTRFYPKNPRYTVPSRIEEDEDDENELTEEEMREFDGDIDEDIPEKRTPVYENNDEDDDLELDYMKYIDKEAFMVLVELLDDKLDVQ